MIIDELKGKSNVKHIMLVLQNLFQVRWDQLGIISNIQGMVYGRVSWNEGGQVVTASLAPVQVLVYCLGTLSINPSILVVIVIEKARILQSLLQTDIKSSHTLKEMKLIECLECPRIST